MNTATRSVPFAAQVGMLNCAGPTEDDPICVPDSGQYPAKDGPDFSHLASFTWQRNKTCSTYGLSLPSLRVQASP